jgi:hypothetical protein
MKTFLKYALALIVTYFFAWTASYIYIFVSGGGVLDFSYYLDYLVMAWTFNAGEIPTVVFFFSLVAFFPLAVFVVGTLYLLGRKKKRAA